MPFLEIFIGYDPLQLPMNSKVANLRKTSRVLEAPISATGGAMVLQHSLLVSFEVDGKIAFL